MPIQAPQFSGQRPDPLAYGRANETRKANDAMAAASAGQNANNIITSIMSFIPGVGPLFAAIGKGIGDMAAGKEKAEAQKKIDEVNQQAQRAQQGNAVIQAASVGQAPGSMGQPAQQNDLSTFLSGLGQQRMG